MSAVCTLAEAQCHSFLLRLHNRGPARLPTHDCGRELLWGYHVVPSLLPGLVLGLSQWSLL